MHAERNNVTGMQRQNDPYYKTVTKLQEWNDRWRKTVFENHNDRC